jgi:hypothetical protein
MRIGLAKLPDDLIDWRGSAADLAQQVNTLLSQLLPGADAAVNERLVRYYVQEWVLDAPEREGREAVFRFRQLLQLLVARVLLHDKWPLKKVAELIREADLDSLLALAPGSRRPTRAEEVIAGFQRPVVPETLVALASPAFLEPEVSPDRDVVAALPARALEAATDISQRRSALGDNLRALGNDAGKPERRRTLRVTLTPWCHVYLGMDQVRSMDERTPEILGAALTQALQEERIKKGEQT